MHRILIAAIAAIPLLFSGHALAGWSYVPSDLKAKGTRYAPVVEHKGKLCMLSNGSYQTDDPAKLGDVWVSIQTEGDPSKAFSAPKIAISRSTIRAKGQTEKRGQAIDWARTSSLVSDGTYVHALINVGAIYGHPLGYRSKPAYARSADCLKWTYYGLVNGFGDIFSSSMALVRKGATYFHVVDVAGGLFCYKSSDMRNWSKISGDISKLSDDYAKGAAFAGLSYDGKTGLFHLTHNGPSKNSSLRYLISKDCSSWSLKSKSQASVYKGCEHYHAKGKIECHGAGKRYTIVTGESGGVTGSGGSTSSGGACTNPSVSTSGTSATAKWIAGTCDIKVSLSDGTSRYKGAVTSGQWTFTGLPRGTHTFRVRPVGGSYVSKAFTIN